MTKTLAALKAAESFICGFEDDPMQEGIPAMLTKIRAAITLHEGQAARLRDPSARWGAILPTSDRLYNCCTGNARPDWSQFEQLEIGGCVTEDEGTDDEHTDGLQPASKAKFFTVYGRFPEPDGTCEAITDIIDPRHALAVAGELALLSGLPVIVHPTLGEELPR